MDSYYHLQTVLDIWVGYIFESNQTLSLKELTHYLILFLALVTSRNYLLYLGIYMLSLSPSHEHIRGMGI